MFLIIKDNKVIWKSDKEITQENMAFDKLIEGDFDVNKNYILYNWEFKEEEIVQEKDSLINEYKLLQKQAEELRTTYLTYKLDTSDLSLKVQEKLEIKWEDIRKQLNDKINYLVTTYWEDILNELI